MAPPIAVREERRVWSWPERAAYWLYGFLLGPFLTKHVDGTVTGSMTRWAVAAFTVAEIMRLTPYRTPEGWTVPPIGWPDVFMAFFILYALPIDNALSRAKPAEVLELLQAPFARAGEMVDSGAAVTTTLTQEVTPDPDPHATLPEDRT